MDLVETQMKCLQPCKSVTLILRHPLYTLLPTSVMSTLDQKSPWPYVDCKKICSSNKTATFSWWKRKVYVENEHGYKGPLFNDVNLEGERQGEKRQFRLMSINDGPYGVVSFILVSPFYCLCYYCLKWFLIDVCQVSGVQILSAADGSECLW